MTKRSRAERLERLRGKRKRIYVVAAVIVVTLGVAVAGAGLLISAPPAEQQASKADTLDSKESSETTLTSTAASSTVPVELPDLVGMPIAEAELLLRAAGLGVLRVPTPTGDSAEGAVLAQTPAAGTRVGPGSPVELVYADSAAVAVATAGATLTTDSATRGPVVCIDPGHQGQGNSATEPVGPGSSETKPKVTGGAVGVVTRQAEHALVLDLSLKIKERLERYGVTVVMTRTTAAVDISNSQRAAVANEADADLFLRVHADSNTNADIRGISTLSPGGNEWVAPIEADSLKAAGMVHRQMLASTGATDRGVVKRADLSGFNYAAVPSILIEVGFLSNPVDDRQLSDSAYQDKLADGVARGVLEYLGVVNQ